MSSSRRRPPGSTTVFTEYEKEILSDGQYRGYTPDDGLAEPESAPADPPSIAPSPASAEQSPANSGSV